MQHRASKVCKACLDPTGPGELELRGGGAAIAIQIMLKSSLSKQPMASNVRLALTQQVELGIQSQIYARYRSKASRVSSGVLCKTNFAMFDLTWN